MFVILPKTKTGLAEVESKLTPELLTVCITSWCLALLKITKLIGKVFLNTVNAKIAKSKSYSKTCHLWSLKIVRKRQLVFQQSL